MQEYQLEIKQAVHYTRCRIYRDFMQDLIADREIRTNGDSCLYAFTVLCSYANFRTSYRRLYGITYTLYPGEWAFRVSELKECLRVRTQQQMLNILTVLQKRGMIKFSQLGHDRVIKYAIQNWASFNTILDYNCRCQKDIGFFFFPISTASFLVAGGRCSEMDVLLDLWISTVYNDEHVPGSSVGPIAYLRNDTGSPLISYAELSARWGISKAGVSRVLHKLSDKGYISLLTFPGRHGTVICLENYLSTMFQISDVPLEKEKVAQSLNIKTAVEEAEDTTHACAESEPASSDSCVSNPEIIVSDLHIEEAAKETEKVLARQWFAGSKLRNPAYRLSKLLSTAKVYIEGLLYGRILKVVSNKGHKAIDTSRSISGAFSFREDGFSSGGSPPVQRRKNRPRAEEN